VLARTRSASLRSLPHDGGSDDADLAAGSSTGQPAHGLTPGLDYLLRHEVSVASESMHGIQNPSEVRVDTQPRREREQLCLPTRTLPSLPKAAAVSGVLVRTLSPAAIEPRSHEPRADCAANSPSCPPSNRPNCGACTPPATTPSPTSPSSSTSSRQAPGRLREAARAPGVVKAKYKCRGWFCL
jgi:hypothetical protein